MTQDDHCRHIAIKLLDFKYLKIYWRPLVLKIQVSDKWSQVPVDFQQKHKQWNNIFTKFKISVSSDLVPSQAILQHQDYRKGVPHLLRGFQILGFFIDPLWSCYSKELAAPIFPRSRLKSQHLRHPQGPTESELPSHKSHRWLGPSNVWKLGHASYPLFRIYSCYPGSVPDRGCYLSAH